MASSTYSPTNFSSDVEMESVIESTTTQSTQPIQPTPISSSKKPKVNFNDPDYELEPDSESNVYIIKNGLFTRSLMPIKPRVGRRVTLYYTM